MKSDQPTRPYFSWTIIKIPLIYFGISFCWIVFSDAFLAGMGVDALHLSKLQTLKGWFFITSTACLLYWLVLKLRQEILETSAHWMKADYQYHLLADNGSDIVSLHTLDGRIQFISPSCQSILGYSADDLINQAFSPLIHPEDQAAFLHFLKTLSSAPSPASAIAMRLRKKGDDYIWVESSGQLYPATNGTEEAQCLLISRDITLRKQNEQALRESEARYRCVVELARDMVWRIDLHGVLTYINPAIQTILGFDPKEVIGRSVGNIITADSMNQYLRSLEKRRIQEFYGPKTAEVYHRHKNGSLVLCEVHSTPVRNEQGEMVEVIGITRDISLRRQAENAIKDIVQATSRYYGDRFFDSMVLELARILSADIALIGRMADGMVHSLAVCENHQIGEDCTFAVEGTPAEMMQKKGLISFSALVQQTFPHDAFLRNHGIEAFAGVPLKNAANQCMGVMMCCFKRPLEYAGMVESILQLFALRVASEMERDFVQQEKDFLEKQLLQSQKMEAVGQLAGGIAHDFNNLLTAIIGFSDLLLKRCPPGDSNYALLENIKTAGDRAASLTRQLLAFSRKQILELRVLDLNALITNLNQMLVRLIGEPIEYTTIMDPHLGLVKADSGQLEQILINLVVNARDAMPDGGHLRLETKNVELNPHECELFPGQALGMYVMISIRDTGCGIPPEIINRVFDPFFTTKPKGKGTGLGLSMVYGLVQQMEGTIRLHSEVGKGTEFQIYLPRIDQVEDAATEESQVEDGLFYGAETILVVEDEQVVLSFAVSSLEKYGYHVLSAESYESAYSIHQTVGMPIDLLLTDVVLPRVSGREIAETLSAKQPGLKVLYMSGYTDDAILRHGIGDSVAFLQKPFSMLELLKKVRSVLDA
ncbi:MAG: PAS domain S-box protein [bacterium]|nr:PAS domain S-box protein [bacterium]